MAEDKSEPGKTSLLQKLAGTATAITIILGLVFLLFPDLKPEKTSSQGDRSPPLIQRPPAHEPLPQEPREKPKVPAGIDRVYPSQSRPTSPPVAINLTGIWTDPDGTVVMITQEGDRVTLRSEMMGSRHLITITGTVEKTFDATYPARVRLSSRGTQLELWMTADGNRLEGTFDDGFTSRSTVLYRR